MIQDAFKKLTKASSALTKVNTSELAESEVRALQNIVCALNYHTSVISHVSQMTITGSACHMPQFNQPVKEAIRFSDEVLKTLSEKTKGSKNEV